MSETLFLREQTNVMTVEIVPVTNVKHQAGVCSRHALARNAMVPGTLIHQVPLFPVAVNSYGPQLDLGFLIEVEVGEHKQGALFNQRGAAFKWHKLSVGCQILPRGANS